MGIGSSLYSALTSSKKKKDEPKTSNSYNNYSNYTTSVNRTNKWSDELESLYGQISNREKFSYDMNNDAIYKQYAQQYANNAKLAMEDTVGQISALTGGYSNSYAATAGQAMYNQQMQGLNDKATELYQLALQQYNAEGDRLNNLYSMTANAYGMEQDRINAEIAEAQWNAQFDEQVRQYNTTMAYNAARDAVADAQWAAGYAFDVGNALVGTAQWATNFAYNSGRDKVADEQWQKTFDYNAGRDAVADSQWQQAFDYQKQRDAVSDSRYASDLAYKYAALNEKKGDNDGVGDENLYTYDNVKAYAESLGNGTNMTLLTEEQFNNYRANPQPWMNGKAYMTADDYEDYLRSVVGYYAKFEE